MQDVISKFCTAVDSVRDRVRHGEPLGMIGCVFRQIEIGDCQGGLEAPDYRVRGGSDGSSGADEGGMVGITRLVREGESPDLDRVEAKLSGTGIDGAEPYIA